MPDDLLPPLLCTALMRVGTRLATGFDQKFRRFGLTQAQFRVLLAVCDAGEAGVAPSDLADRLLVERAAVSILTTRMVGQGRLARMPGENRRTFRLVLTGAGRAVLDEALPQAIALAGETLAGFSREERQDALAFLERLEAHLRKEE